MAYPCFAPFILALHWCSRYWVNTFSNILWMAQNIATNLYIRSWASFANNNSIRIKFQLFLFIFMYLCLIFSFAINYVISQFILMPFLISPMIRLLEIACWVKVLLCIIHVIYCYDVQFNVRRPNYSANIKQIKATYTYILNKRLGWRS